MTKFVWICSYPKSGNTWVRAMLREYFAGAAEGAPSDISDTYPYWYQVVSPQPLHLLDIPQLAQLRPAAMMHLTTQHNGKKPYCLVKSHSVTGEVFGVPMFSPLWVDYAIYIHRDPRDIVASLADHMGVSHEQAATSLAERTSQVGDPPRIPTLVGSWSDHVRGWIAGEKRVQTIVTSYERLHRDTEFELGRVLECLGTEPDKELVKKVVERCTFDKMQEDERLHGFKERSEKQERFFRKGRVGSHAFELSEHLTKKVEKDHWQMMKMLGYV